MTKDIKEFERQIISILGLMIIIALVIISVLFFIIAELNHFKNISENSKQISTTIKTFDSELANELEIIANSTLFIDFLSAGSFSRNDIEPKFLTFLSPLKKMGVDGFTLRNLVNDSFYTYGALKGPSITLKLCYLANKLDAINGNCIGNLTLYFSSEKVLQHIKDTNPFIESVHWGSQFDLITSSKFGNFNILSKNFFKLNLKIRKSRSPILVIYLVLTLALCALGFFYKIKIHNTIKSHILIPLKTIVVDIKNNNALTIQKYSLDEIAYLSQQIEEWKTLINQNREYEKQAGLGKLAAQVAHDIRSPLSVVEMVLAMDNAGLSQNRRGLIQSAIKSIREIADNLLQKHRHPDERDDQSAFMLTPLIETLISHKQVEWQNNPCEIQFHNHLGSLSTLIVGVPVEVKRLLSNLLNNAYEALENNRIIKIVLKDDTDEIILQIQDFGKGISEDKIKDALEGRSSKHTGSGLGLSHAKRYMEQFKGKLVMSSILGTGTTIELYFRKSKNM